jgi:hypothetical protein
VLVLGYNADGRRLGSLDRDGKLRIWDTAGGRSLHVLDVSKGVRDVKGLFFTPDDREVVLLEDDGSLHFWDVSSRKHRRTLRPAVVKPPENIPQIRPLAAFSPGGRQLFLLHYGELRGWDLAAGREMPPFETAVLGPEENPGSYIPALSLSSDGRYLARAEAGLWLYEVASGHIVYRFPGYSTAVAFHPSRLHLAAANEERLDTLIWDLEALFRSQSVAPGRETLAQLWSALADLDAVRGQRSAWQLADMPDMEKYLAARLKPQARPDPRIAEQHIANLASVDYATRQKAERALAARAHDVGVALQRAHQSSRDLEQRLRLKRLLALLRHPSPEHLRQHRAVLALEVRGTPEAQRLLAHLATGAPEAALTEDARAALGRLRAAQKR